ncbi:MAG: magnesium transporter [Planctomycetaceae bacterium]|nr:magnesium transporter [Planctomycetaceae bacterium]
MFDPLLLPELREMLLENDEPAMREFCDVFHAGVIAETLEALTNDEIWRVLLQAGLSRQVEIFEYISLQRQTELVTCLDKPHLSTLLEVMAPDDRADLLQNMVPEHVESLMPLIAQAQRSDIRKLLSYPDHSAGSIMTTEYASLREGLSVAEALAQLRTQAPNRETIYYLYVLDEARHLHGFVSLRKLILARPETPVADIMDRDVISVRVDEDQELVANRMAKYDFIAMPVVDDQGRLVGIVTHDDVIDVLREEATEDAHRFGGVLPLEDSYLSTPFVELAWKRGVWLVLLMVAGFGTAGVLNYYDGVTANLEWLVKFLPLVLASGGNTGSQSATLVIRALALGELNRKAQFHILRREAATGFVLGGSLAVLAFVFAMMYGPVMDAVIVAVTIALVVTLGTINGSLLPMILRSLGMDPAIMSNPLIASLSDMLGVLIYYNVALLAVGRLF